MHYARAVPLIKHCFYSGFYVCFHHNFQYIQTNGQHDYFASDLDQSGILLECVIWNCCSGWSLGKGLPLEGGGYRSSTASDYIDIALPDARINCCCYA